MRFRLGSAFAALTAVSIALAIGITGARAQTLPVLTSSAGAYLAGQAAETRADIAAAAWFYNYVLEGDPANIPLAAQIFSLWVDAGDMAAAAPIASRLIDIQTSYEPGRLVLAVQAMRAGQYATARGHLDAIRGNTLSLLTTNLLKAWLLQAVGDTDGALAAINGMIGPGWFGPFRARHSALIADLAGRTAVALGHAERAFQLEPSPRATMTYASLLARSGNPVAAEAVLMDFLSTTENQPDVAQMLVNVRAGNFGGTFVASAEAGAAEVFFDVAIALGSDDEGVTSVPYFQFARRLAPTFVAATFGLAQLLQSLGRHEEAILVYDGVPASSPFAVRAATRAALSENVIERTAAAITRLWPVVAANPTNTDAAFALANILRAESRFADAIAVLNPALAGLTAPREDHWSLYFVRGMSLERTGDWVGAVADFRFALVLSPDQPDVLNYLGYSWIDRGENPEEAMAMILRAVEQRPDSGYIIDSLGWAHYKLGNYAEAVTVLERAMALTPYQSEINEHLGDAYWAVGRRLEALFQWNHALAYGPEPNAVARVRDKIQNGLP